MKKILLIILIILPALSWGQKMAEMTPDRIFSRKKISPGILAPVPDSTVFYWNNNKGSFRAGYALTMGLTTPSFQEANIGLYSTAFGVNNLSSGQSSFSAGSHNITNASNSMSLGSYNRSTGMNSISLGTYANAEGIGAVALSNGLAQGNYSLAFSGGNSNSLGSMAFLGGRTFNGGSLAIGEDVHATAWHSSAIGHHLTANSDYSLSVGQWSDSTINVSSPIFVVGTGYSSTNRKNGFVVFQSGNAVHKGLVTVNSNNQPRASLDVVGTDAIIVPVGTTAQRPSGLIGMIRFNTTTQKYEGYTASGVWVDFH